MTTVIHRGGEGLADTTALTTGNSGGPAGTAFNAVVGAVTASTTHAAHGTRSQKCVVATASTATGQDTTSLGTVTVVRFRTYLWIDGAPPANMRVMQVDNGTTLACGVGLSTARFIRLNDSASAQMSLGTVATPTGQWVRLEGRMVASATVGQASLKIWHNASSTGSPDDSISSTASFNTLGQFTRYQSGILFTASQTHTLYVDEVVWTDVDSGEIGPYVDPVTVTADIEGGTPLAPFDSTSGAATSSTGALTGAAGLVLDSRSAASYVRVGPVTTGTGRRWMTLNAWMRLPSGTLTENAPLLRFRNTDPQTSGGGGNGDVWIDHTDQSVRGDLQPADSFASAASLIAANTWFLLQAVCSFRDDGTSSMKVKVNGTEIGTITSTLPVAGEALQHVDIGAPSTVDSILHVDQITVRVSDTTLDYLLVTATAAFDTVTSTDTGTRAVSLPRTAADTVTASDSAAAAVLYSRTAADSVSVTETATGITSVYTGGHLPMGTTTKGVAGGLATLDTNGKLLTAQRPTPSIPPAAAVTDQGALTATAPAALTAAAAVGANPTKAEFDLLLADVTEVRTKLAAAVVDLAAARTKVNALLASLRTGGLLTP